MKILEEEGIHISFFRIQSSDSIDPVDMILHAGESYGTTPAQSGDTDKHARIGSSRVNSPRSGWIHMDPPCVQTDDVLRDCAEGVIAVGIGHDRGADKVAVKIVEADRVSHFESVSCLGEWSWVNLGRLGESDDCQVGKECPLVVVWVEDRLSGGDLLVTLTKRDVKEGSILNAAGGGEHESVGDEAACAEPGIVDEDGGVVGQRGTSLGIVFDITLPHCKKW